MDLVVRKNDLLKELQLVQGIVERKNSIPILSNVLTEAHAGELGHGKEVHDQLAEASPHGSFRTFGAAHAQWTRARH